MKTLILSNDPLFLKRMAEILDPSSPLSSASNRNEALGLLEGEGEFDIVLIDSAMEKEPATGLLPLLFQQFPSVGRILILRNEHDLPSPLAHYSVGFSSSESIRQRLEMARNWSRLFRQHQQLIQLFSQQAASPERDPRKAPLFGVEENGKTNGQDREKALRRSNDLLRKLATTDPLTGIGNRRVLSQQLQRELSRAKRYERALSLLFIDIDYFKSLNDRYGHAVGDQMLRELAECLMSSVRRIDIIARYGGEEFVIILPETMKEHALLLADRIRRKVARYPFGQAYSIPVGTLTVSIGVASYPEDGTSATRLIAHADQALYSAKRQGRNLVLGAPLS
ncbi:MAG: GGDEF domain-containing protein [Deltaproteobacteria bacterium]|nr:GGDEF domain-containing protein [Deltaproteobacteria bacterium]